MILLCNLSVSWHKGWHCLLFHNTHVIPNNHSRNHSLRSTSAICRSFLKLVAFFCCCCEKYLYPKEKRKLELFIHEYSFILLETVPFFPQSIQQKSLHSNAPQHGLAIVLNKEQWTSCSPAYRIFVPEPRKTESWARRRGEKAKRCQFGENKRWVKPH